MEIEALNEKYGLAGQIVFATGNGDLPIALINNQHAVAVISLYGAQVLSFQPDGEKDLLWLSSKSTYEDGKAIRGGIPICFPWFGPHATDALLPQHGFARISTWEVAETSLLENGATQIRLHLHHSPATMAMWPFAFSAIITVTVARKMELSLEVINTGDADFTFTDALHTYFNISDIEAVSIDGLQSAGYYEGKDPQIKTQEELLLVIAKAEDRRYIDHTKVCTIYDKEYKRRIRVSKTGSKTTVLWNPWAETTKKMNDMPEDGYKHFLCLEAANAFNDFVELKPGGRFIISTTIESL